ncbi:MAG: hypothetical protein A2107_08565 [Verrucomicrobia bacterium GWF2_62_7]|nr:MAG: hypothetical protein A2107_08565 [Verrucomicrobia bacterium GWF2_62_7]
MRSFIHLLLVVIGCFAISAAEPVVETVVVISKPRFEVRNDLFSYLVISDKNRSCDIRWGIPQREIQFVPLSLDTNRVYTFTMLVASMDNTTEAWLHRVQLGGQMIYDIAECEIHKTKMEHKEVPIGYGFIALKPDHPSLDTEHRLFPHRIEYKPGGCSYSPGMSKTTKVYVCAECKKAYEKWKVENKATK